MKTIFISLDYMFIKREGQWTNFGFIYYFNKITHATILDVFLCNRCFPLPLFFSGNIAYCRQEASLVPFYRSGNWVSEILCKILHSWERGLFISEHSGSKADILCVLNGYYFLKNSIKSCIFNAGWCVFNRIIESCSCPVIWKSIYASGCHTWTWTKICWRLCSNPHSRLCPQSC